MSRPRGESGEVLGMMPGRVRELLSGAVKALDDAGGEFSRHDLRRHFLAEGLDEDVADAMIHAFWRVVPARAVSYGVYELPEGADVLVEHRAWRFNARFDLADILRLLDLFASGRLTPGLEAFAERATKAVAGLNPKPAGQ